MKQHYVPQFYLKNWAHQGNQVYTYLISDGKTKLVRAPTSSTSFKKDLYKQHNVKDEQWIEKEHFQRVDRDASVVFKKISHNEGAFLTDLEKNHFSEFLASLPYRNQDIINNAHMELPGISSEIHSELKKKTLPEMHAELDEKVEIYNKDLVTKTIVSTISPIGSKLNPYGLKYFNDNMGALLNSFWWIEDFSSLCFTVITSDNPIGVFMDPDLREFLKSPYASSRGIFSIVLSFGYLVSFPISPTRILFIHRNKVDLGDIFLDKHRKRLLKFHNKAMITRKVKFVYAIDDSQDKFIKKHFKAW